MQTATWCERMNDNPPCKGNRRSLGLTLNAIRTSAALILTGATTPIMEVSSNAQRVRWAASDSAAVVVHVQVPLDYCEDEADGADEFEVRFLAAMSGSTDTPVLTVGCDRNRAGAAEASLTADATGAITGTTLAEYRAVLSGQGIRAGDSLTLTITPGAHTTDAIHLYGIDVEVRQQWVAADRSIRSASA